MFLHQVSLHCGVFMLVCISLDLYLSNIHAVQMKPMVIHCCCLTIWLFCLLLSIPDWMFLQDFVNYRVQDKTECVHLYPYNFSTFGLSSALSCGGLRCACNNPSLLFHLHPAAVKVWIPVHAEETGLACHCRPSTVLLNQLDAL